MDVEEDIKKLQKAIEGGGIHPCKLHKAEKDRFVSVEEHYVYEIDCEIASTITSRYYKGISAHRDNAVLEVVEK